MYLKHIKIDNLSSMIKGISLFLFFCFSIGYSQTKTPEDIINRSGNLFYMSSDNALDYLFKTNETFNKKEQKFVEDYKNNFYKTIHDFGKFQDFEILNLDNEKKINYSKKVRRYQVILYYEIRALLLDVWFYNVSDSWKLYDLKYAKFYGFNNLSPNEEQHSPNHEKDHSH